MEELAVPFSHNLSEHLKINDKQCTALSSKFLNTITQYNKGEGGQPTIDPLLPSSTRKTTHVFSDNVINSFINVKGDILCQSHPFKRRLTK
jgi:hypothetical protein